MRHFSHILLRINRILLITPIFFSGKQYVYAEEIIRINGSGTCLEMIKPVMESYIKDYHGTSFRIEKPLGSSGSIKALLAGAVDIAIVSRQLKSEEAAMGANLKVYGITPLAIVTEKKVRVKAISAGELADIYSGKTVKWPDGTTIRVILRPNEDTDTKILKALSAEMADAVTKAHGRRGVRIALNDTESNEAVSLTSGAIGTSGLAGVLAGKPALNVLTLNGVKPGRDTLADGTYPLSKEINFVTTAGLSDAAVKFLRFIYSEKGRAIAEKNGVLVTVDKK